MKTVKISDLVRQSNGVTTHDGDVFSGRAVELNAGGERLREHHYWEGYLHGSVREFYADGTNKSDIRHEKGVPHGLGLEWDTDGNMVQMIYQDGVVVKRSDDSKPSPGG